MIFLSQIESVIPSDMLPPSDGERFVYWCYVRVGWTNICAPIVGRYVNSAYKFYGAEEVVKSYMLLHGLTTEYFKFSIYRKWLDSDYDPSYCTETQQQVFYLGTPVSGLPVADDLYTDRFFTVHNKAVIYPGQYIYLAAGDIRDADMFYYKKDGTSYRIEQEVEQGWNEWEVPWGSNYVRMEAYIEQVHRFTLYFLDGSAVEHFRFRNVFNCWESVSLPAAITAEPSEEFDTVQQDKVLKKYNSEQHLKMNTASGYLPAFMYDTLLEFCRANIVQYKEKGEWYDIIITEYKLDKSNEPNTPLKLELSFEFADIEHLELMDY